MNSAPLTIEIRPNCSLTPRGAQLFFASICLVTFAIAGFFATQGFWPVLPFAGLEMLLLGWALRTNLQRRFHSQSIVIDENQVAVAEKVRKLRTELVFPRHWAQVKMHGGRSPLAPSRLRIEAYGRGCEVGSFLNEQERRSLALRLTRLIGRFNESPSLPSQSH